MMIDINKAVKIFDALSDKTRLRIFIILLKGKLCVCELMDILNMKQSRISHCMKILKNAELVDSYREGKWIIYTISPEINKNGIIKGVKNELKIQTKGKSNFKKCKK